MLDALINHILFTVTELFICKAHTLHAHAYTHSHTHPPTYNLLFHTSDNCSPILFFNTLASESCNQHHYPVWPVVLHCETDCSFPRSVEEQNKLNTILYCTSTILYIYCILTLYVDFASTCWSSSLCGASGSVSPNWMFVHLATKNKSLALASIIL